MAPEDRGSRSGLPEALHRRVLKPLLGGLWTGSSGRYSHPYPGQGLEDKAEARPPDPTSAAAIGGKFLGRAAIGRARPAASRSWPPRGCGAEVGRGRNCARGRPEPGVLPPPPRPPEPWRSLRCWARALLESPGHRHLRRLLGGPLRLERQRPDPGAGQRGAAVPGLFGGHDPVAVPGRGAAPDPGQLRLPTPAGAPAPPACAGRGPLQARQSSRSRRAGGALELLLAGGLGPARGRCVRWGPRERRALFLQAAPHPDISCCVASFRFEMHEDRYPELPSQAHGLGADGACRPYSDPELLLAACTSDFGLATTQSCRSLLPWWRLPMSSDRHCCCSGGGGWVSGGCMQASIHTPLHFSVWTGPGPFLFMGWSHFGEAWLGCARRFQEFICAYVAAHTNHFCPVRWPWTEGPGSRALRRGWSRGSREGLPPGGTSCFLGESDNQ
ncbi:meteorin [Callorhinus ursinus]|uniref:meteorin n=1 Tax=Callorhinus ursinus TaxID=34884 RepID=UPI003CD02CFC